MNSSSDCLLSDITNGKQLIKSHYREMQENDVIFLLNIVKKYRAVLAGSQNRKVCAVAVVCACGKKYQKSVACVLTSNTLH
jgi:hypothetical protein